MLSPIARQVDMIAVPLRSPRGPIVSRPIVVSLLLAGGILAVVSLLQAGNVSGGGAFILSLGFEDT